MADLGSIGQGMRTSGAVIGGYLSFQTQDSTAAVISRNVRVFRRSTGAIYFERISDQAGFWYQGVPPADAATLFDVQCLDDVAGTQLADVFYAQITPHAP